MDGWFPDINGRGEIASGGGLGEIWVAGVQRAQGIHPRFVTDDWLVYGHGTGTQLLNVSTGEVRDHVQGYNLYAAGGGRWAGLLQIGTTQLHLWDLNGSAPRIVEMDRGAPAVSRSGRLLTTDNFQGTVKRLLLDDAPIFTGAVMSVSICDQAAVAQVATSTYGRAVKGIRIGGTARLVEDWTIEAWEDPVVTEGPDGPWVASVTQTGLIFRPAGSRLGYRWPGEFLNPAARWLGDHFLIVASDSHGQLRQVTVDPGSARGDLTPAGPPTDPPPTIAPPAVTILYFPPSVHFGDPARCVADLTGGPADRLIWLDRIADAADWHISAVNVPADPDHTYVFQAPGDWEIGARVEGPGGVNQTATRRVVHVEADGPIDPPQRSDRFWFGPNIKSADLLQSFSEPDRWAAARAHVGVFQFYAQQITSYIPSVGPNTYEALVAVDAFRKLTEWGIAIAVEIGSVKQGDCLATGYMAQLTTIAQRIHDAGGTLTHIAMDEPLTGAKKCPNTIEQTADAVAAFIRRGRELGAQVGWVEAWPEIDLETQRRFLMLLDERGALPNWWHLDHDVHRQALDPVACQAISDICADYGMPFGVILAGYPATTDQIYSADVRGRARSVKGLPVPSDHIVIQSWATRGEPGPQDLPRNLSESEADSHTAIVNAVAEVFA